jgi:negative regulator of sigma E activity
VQDSNRLHFTDGLAAFSIFIERSNASLPEMTTHRGGTTVITRTLKGAAGQITVVGEVPISTARKVVESVEPVIF